VLFSKSSDNIVLKRGLAPLNPNPPRLARAGVNLFNTIDLKSEFKEKSLTFLKMYVLLLMDFYVVHSDKDDSETHNTTIRLEP
jgi:hypothetical protein